MMSVVIEDLTRRVESFLYQEALLLDEDRYDEWLELLTEDVWYVCPLVEWVDGIESNIAEEGGHYFDEDKQSLRNRVSWLTSGRAPIEVPPSIKRRLISNVVVDDATDDELRVASNFMLWQIRPRQSEGALFVGRRYDRLRFEGEELRLAERRIELAHPVLPRALSAFF